MFFSAAFCPNDKNPTTKTPDELKRLTKLQVGKKDEEAARTV